MKRMRAIPKESALDVLSMLILESSEKPENLNT
jgi:hypothetical protein